MIDTRFGLPRNIVVKPPPQMPTVVAVYWDTCVVVGEETDVCPVLLSSIHWRESRSGTSDYLFPKGPAGTGDWETEETEGGRRRRIGTYGHGRGLMQIDDRQHVERLRWVDEWLKQVDEEGVPLWQKPEENIRCGAMIYASNRSLFGSVGGLANYNCHERHVKKVLTEMRHGAPLHELVAALDKHTSPKPKGTYVADVLAHRARWLAGGRPGSLSATV